MAFEQKLSLEVEAKALQKGEKFKQKERWAEFARLKEEKIKSAEPCKKALLI